MSNLPKDLESKHQMELKSASSLPPNDDQIDLSKLLYRPRVLSTYGWLSYLIDWLHSFSVVQNDDFRMHVLLCSKLSLNTLKFYMVRLTIPFEASISGILPDSFALVLDGQTTPEAKYFALFATFRLKAVQYIDWLAWLSH